MRNMLISSALIVFLFFASYGSSYSQGIEGTYVLESRVMADGTVIKPPQIMGVYNLEDGYVNFNLAYKDSSGNIQSIALMGQYKFNSSTFQQEIFFFSMHDEIRGGEKVHDFSKKEGSSPVTINGDKIEFVFPPHKNVHATFEGDRLIAKRVDGSYTDNWKKVE